MAFSTESDKNGNTNTYARTRFYNEMVQGFLNQTLHPPHNRLFLQEIQEYMDYWRNLEYDENDCSCCTYFLSKRWSPHLLERTKQFALRMPQNSSGMLLTWYFIKSEVKAKDLKELALPSIFTHLMLRVCSGDTAVRNRSILFRVEEMIDLMTKVIDLENTDEIEDNQHTKVLQKLIAQLYDYIKIIISCDLKKGGCFGFDDSGSRCVYANTGDFNISCLNRSLSCDARQFVNPLYVNDPSFYSSHNYCINQPGIVQTFKERKIKHELNNLDKIVKREIMALEAKKHYEKQHSFSSNMSMMSLFEVEGELQPSQSFAIRGMDKQINKYNKMSQLLKEELTTLLRLHTIAHDHDISVMKYYISMFKMSKCVWCSLCISPGARRIIFDMMDMSRTRMYSAGMGIETIMGSLLTGVDSVQNRFSYGTANEREMQSQRKVKSIYTVRAKGRTKPAHKSKEYKDTYNSKDILDYKLCLETMLIPTAAVQNVYEECMYSKYSCMGEWFAEVGLSKDFEKNQIVDEIHRHCASDKNIMCITNTRRMFFDADCFFKQHHVCLLPIILSFVEIIFSKTKKSVQNSILRNSELSCLTSRHHIHIQLTAK